MPLAPSHIQLHEDQVALIEAVRVFSREELLPLDRKWDEDESSVSEALPRVCELGLMNLTIPESLGGVGCPYSTYVSILHEISVYSPSMCVTVGVHSMVGAIVEATAREPKRTEWLSKWGRPEHFAAFALSEANAGSDARAVQLLARKVPGGYRLNGEKMWTTNGLSARWLLTLARLEGSEEREGLCAFMVDAHEEGIDRTKIKGKMGIRGSETAVISFSDTFVPADHLLGDEGEGLNVFLTTLSKGRIGIAAQATGISEACLDEMVSYARQRQQFDQPIGKFQAVENMIADSALELEVSKSLVWRAAAQVERGDLCPGASSMAKAYASEAANRTAYRAVQLHGGTGYVRECRVEQLYRDARVTTIYEGTSEIQRLVIARELSGD